MGLNSYSALVASVADWLARNDLAAQIPDFVALAESTIRRRVRRKTTRAALSLTTGAVALPATAAELRSIRLDTGTLSRDNVIKVVTPEALAELRQQMAPVGQPRYAAVVNATLLLAPAPDQTYSAEIIYYEALPALQTASVNAVLTEAPDIYLYGTLLESAPYLEHDERIPVWQSRLDRAIDELNLAREREEYSGSLQAPRLPMVF